MLPSLRRLLPWALTALAGTILVAWNGMQGFAFNDYDAEAAPAYAALVNGDVSLFLGLSPSYGGSLIMRAPFAALPELWGGGELAVFRLAALPCLLAGVALGIVLVAEGLARDLGRGALAGLLFCCAVNPLTWRALELGHPEELLGAVLCAGAVLAGCARRPALAGTLLGLAIANKAWGLLAVGPVLLALPHGRRQAMAIAGGLALCLTLPVVLASEPGTAGSASALHATGDFFPWQVWWFFGATGDVWHGAAGDTVARSAPAWLGPIPHPLIVALAVPFSWLAWRRGGDPVLLLALLFLLRCVLDPWNNIYYALPLVIALAAWEGSRERRAPYVALTVLVATFIAIDRMRGVVSPDVASAFYLAWAIPLGGYLTWRLVDPAGEHLPSRWARARGAQAASLACR
jgi:hypothetical protein